MSLAEFCERNQKYATLILRLGIAFVFLWFGIDKFIHTVNWIGWVPQWMQALIPFSMNAFMYGQGVIETIIGLMLLVGYKVRFASLLASITIAGVLISLIGTGQAEIMVRDTGLLAASLSLFLTGCKCMSVDSLKK